MMPLNMHSLCDQILGDQVVQVQRPIDKKQVLFYNDKSHNFDVDEEIQKLWRSVTVEGVDEGKIEDYLSRQGISSMQDTGISKAVSINTSLCYYS